VQPEQKSISSEETKKKSNGNVINFETIERLTTLIVNLAYRDIITKSETPLKDDPENIVFNLSTKFPRQFFGGKFFQETLKEFHNKILKKAETQRKQDEDWLKVKAQRRSDESLMNPKAQPKQEEISKEKETGIVHEAAELMENNNDDDVHLFNY